jgi:hypothetical protein
MTPLYVRARLHEARAILADPASRQSLSPRWFDELVIDLLDDLADDRKRDAYKQRLAQALSKTEAWTPERWEGARVDFLCLTIDQALISAKGVCYTLGFWPAVDAAGQQVKRALRGDGALKAAYRAAERASWDAYVYADKATIYVDRLAANAARQAAHAALYASTAWENAVKSSANHAKHAAAFASSAARIEPCRYDEERAAVKAVKAAFCSGLFSNLIDCLIIAQDSEAAS